MYNIKNYLPIEVWKIIADKVQELEFSDCSELEFYKNLRKLTDLLYNTNVSFETGSRNPKDANQAGLATLLQMIYEISSKNKNVKEKFYEQIMQLEELKIKTIKLDAFGLEAQSKSTYIQQINDCLLMKKIYTDGVFKLNRTLKSNDCKIYAMEEIDLASYILDYDLYGYKNILNIEQAKASLMDFKGEFPTLEEVKKIEFPKLLIPEQTINWDEEVQQLCLDFDKQTYQKRFAK